MAIVLGVDLGTSYFKVGAFDSAGRLVGLGRISVPKQSFDGRCELPLDQFWATLRQGVQLALESAGVHSNQVAALGYASQANSFLLLDADDRPLTPLILWPDLRAPLLFPVVREHAQSPNFTARTGMGFMSPAMCVQKLRWFQENEPELWSQTAAMLTISDYLVFGLTGQRKGDLGTAALLGLADLRRAQWWQDALLRMGLSGLHLSRLHRPGTVVGGLLQSDPHGLGLTGGIPFVLGGLDHHMAALGAGLGYLADCCESTGTVLAWIAQSADYRPQEHCCMGPGIESDDFYQLTFTHTGASGLEWYQKKHAPNLSIPQLMEEAAKAPLGCNGLTACPEIHEQAETEPFQGGRWQGEHGLCARAIMEATAAALAELRDRLRSGDAPRRVLSTGGGARSSLWLQIKSDLLGCEMIKSVCEEPACKGAALLAARAVGWFDDTEQARGDWLKIDNIYSPDMKRHQRYRTWLERYRERYGGLT